MKRLKEGLGLALGLVLAAQTFLPSAQAADAPKGFDFEKYGLAKQDLMLPNPDTVSCKFSNLRDNIVKHGNTTVKAGHIATATCGEKTYEMAFQSGKNWHNYKVTSNVNDYTITWNSLGEDHGKNIGFGKNMNVRVTLGKEVNGQMITCGDGIFKSNMGTKGEGYYNERLVRGRFTAKKSWKPTKKSPVFSNIKGHLGVTELRIDKMAKGAKSQLTP